jgi:hypothetical protein
MSPQIDTDYNKLFSELIKKQMMVLGPDITLAKVKNVTGITVTPAGEVQKIEGDPQQLLQALINQFVELSGMIVKKTMESILTSYPGMMAMSSALGGMNTEVKIAPQPEPSSTTSMKITNTQESVSSVNTSSEPQQESTSFVKNEPPPITDMKLESLSQTPKVEEKTQNQEQAFSSKEIEDLNKALEELSKAPMTNENAQNASNAVSN